MNAIMEMMAKQQEAIDNLTSKQKDAKNNPVVIRMIDVSYIAGIRENICS